MDNIKIENAIRVLNHERFNYSLLPLKDAIDCYANEGGYLGGFLVALLVGDYKAAIAKADDTNLWLMPIYAAYLYNEIPANIHGSVDNVAAHLKACAIIRDYDTATIMDNTLRVLFPGTYNVEEEKK